jgi:hypothetical protein
VPLLLLFESPSLTESFPQCTGVFAVERFQQFFFVREEFRAPKIRFGVSRPAKIERELFFLVPRPPKKTLGTFFAVPENADSPRAENGLNFGRG